jgi:hypothetical protein
VSLGLCSQIELDQAVARAAEAKAREETKRKKEGPGLKPVAETVDPTAYEREEH